MYRLPLLSALFGLTSLIYQMVGFEIVFLFFVSGHKAVAISTSSFLFGIALSSLLFTRLIGKDQVETFITAVLVLLLGYALFVLRFYPSMPELLNVNRSLAFAVMWIFLFIPAFLIGGVLPLINGLYVRDIDRSIRDTGLVYFFDTVGAAMGSILTGFVLLPHFGIEGSLKAAMGLTLILIVTSFPRRLSQSLAFCAVLAVVLFFLLGKRTEYGQLSERFGKVLFQKQSEFGVVTVGISPRGNKTLFINFRTMCLENPNHAIDPEMISSNQMAYDIGARLPPKSTVLNIGLGCGMTAAHLLEQRNLGKLDIVEINPVVVEAAKTYFGKENQNVTRRPNVSVIVENGVTYIDRIDKLYNAIVIDIEEVSVIYSSPLYSHEYIEKMKAKLHPGGTLGIWSFYVNPGFTRILKDTMSKSFPYTVVAYYGRTVVVFGSTRPLEVYQPTAHQNQQREVESIAPLGINTLSNGLLEKHYDSNQIFSLPDDYEEKFVR